MAILAAVLLTAASLACSVEVTPDSPLLPAATDSPTYAVAPTHAPLPTYAAEPTYAPQPTYDAGASVIPLPAATVLPTYAARPSLTPHIHGGWRLIRLADNLDDPQGYCIDVPGFGDNLRLDAPLQAHTCKPGSDDQLFALPTDAIPRSAAGNPDSPKMAIFGASNTDVITRIYDALLTPFC